MCVEGPAVTLWRYRLARLYKKDRAPAFFTGIEGSRLVTCMFTTTEPRSLLHWALDSLCVVIRRATWTVLCIQTLRTELTEDENQ